MAVPQLRSTRSNSVQQQEPGECISGRAGHVAECIANEPFTSRGTLLIEAREARYDVIHAVVSGSRLHEQPVVQGEGRSAEMKVQAARDVPAGRFDAFNIGLKTTQRVSRRINDGAGRQAGQEGLSES